MFCQAFDYTLRSLKKPPSGDDGAQLLLQSSMCGTDTIRRFFDKNKKCKKKGAVMGDNRKFMLKKHCFLVLGSKRGAIYDLKSGEVYSVNKESVGLIKKCEEGHNLQKIFCSFDLKNKKEAEKYLFDLKELGLGVFLNGNNLIEKIPITEPGDKLSFVWLEISSACNLRCLHCYNNSGPSREITKTKMSSEDWKKTLDAARNLGCKRVQLIGGEPLICRELAHCLIRHASFKKFDDIEIFTNATLLGESDINVFLENKVKVSSSLYGSSSMIHDKITKTEGSFKKTISALKFLKKRGVPTRVSVTMMSYNEEDYTNIADFLKEETGIEDVRYDIVRAVGRGSNSSLLSPKLKKKQRMTSPAFGKCYLETFRKKKFGHSCLANKICVRADGEVTPCIMERRKKFGNILLQNLDEIWHGEAARKTRSLSKDKISTCKDCEYRYACFDCRPVVETNKEYQFIKPQSCGYDPYSGLWGK